DSAPLDGGRDERARAFWGGEVGRDEGGRARGLQRLQFGGVVPGACDDERSRSGEGLADGQSNALACPGDDDDFVVQVHVHDGYVPPFLSRGHQSNDCTVTARGPSCRTTVMCARGSGSSAVTTS